MSWTNRLRRSPGSPPLRQVQQAAQNLADQAGIAPSKARIVFQTVTDVTILTSALIGGALGAIHLWKTIFPKHKPDENSPEPASGRAPPRRPLPHTAAVFADDHEGHEKNRNRSR